jgi:hypothetical protein
MTDVRELYQAKQAARKIKKINYDETKHRDEVDTSTQIRSYPMVASSLPEKDLPASTPVNQINSTSVIKKSKGIANEFLFNFFFSLSTKTIC